MTKFADTSLPRHVGIIMDGNGRWAQARALERSAGHREGAKVFKKICEYACDIGIPAVTFYAFSAENWRRPEEEVAGIISLLREYLLEALERREENGRKGMRIRFIGDLSVYSEEITGLVRELEEKSAGQTRTMVNIAVNYGGRQEILRAAQRVAELTTCGKLRPQDITLADIEAGLYTAGQPEPDFIIRPSGEYRLSNFLLWQCAYAEFWFSDILWPDFTTNDFDRALLDFSARSRRFGGV
jgi:undecaprenyl diphosphate synthase